MPLRPHRAAAQARPHRGPGGEETRLDHLGVEVASTEEVDAAAGRLREAGLATSEEYGTTCCHAVQDKVWVTGPGNEPWKVYVVNADAGAVWCGGSRDAACC